MEIVKMNMKKKNKQRTKKKKEKQKEKTMDYEKKKKMCDKQFFFSSFFVDFGGKWNLEKSICCNSYSLDCNVVCLCWLFD